jgi:hypothetical protein
MKTVESEILLRINFKMACMEFSQFVTSEKHLLKVARNSTTAATTTLKVK